MYHDHGENDRLDYQPQPAKLTAWQMLMIRLGVTRRNRLDARQQAAAQRSLSFYVDRAMSALSRIGGGK